MKITPLDIRRKEFKRSVRGYSDEEVDIFLDEVADEFERLFQENMELQDKMHRLDEQIAGHAQLREALEKTLISAQLQAEELRSNAHKESELILRDAEMKARDIVSDSYGETQKTQQALVQLKLLEEDFRFKFRSLLEGYLRLVNEAPLASDAPAVAPAAAPATPAPAVSSSPQIESSGEEAPPAAPVRDEVKVPVSPQPAPAVAPSQVQTSPAQAAAPVQATPQPPAPPATDTVSVAPSAPSAPSGATAAPAAPPVPEMRPTPAPAAPVAAPPMADVNAPSARPITPPAQSLPLADDEIPTEESDFPLGGSLAAPAYPDATQQLEPTVEATAETDTAEVLFDERQMGERQPVDEEPLRRFFFGRQLNDVDDTFQADDAAKKDKNREFEW